MILGDKIIDLRKRRGWSQEQLAEQLGVSRQSVSKWESAMSIPDMDKIVKMSYIFGVSTDYLLKDEVEAEEPSTDNGRKEYDGHYISVETANAFMEAVENTAGKIAAAVSMYIMSVIPVIFLVEISEYSGFLSEDMAGGISVAFMLTAIAAATAIIIFNELKLEKYEYIEKEDIILEYGLSGIIEKKMNEYENTHGKLIATGVGICIAGVVPLMITAGLENEFISVIGLCMLMVCIAMGVYCIVLTETINESYMKLLQIGDFTQDKKYAKRKLVFLPSVYWCGVTAIYLAVSFYTFDWHRTWIIWPVTAVAYAAVLGIAQGIVLKNR